MKSLEAAVVDAGVKTYEVWQGYMACGSMP